VRVVLYSRPGCHLCDQALQVLVAEQKDHPFELDEVDVQDDEDLEREYGIRIPVIEVDGEERFEYEIDPEELSRIVRGD
jgi:glutaredoxin